MSWNASVISGGSWLLITSGSSGENSGTINTLFSQNTGISSRTATIRITAAGANDSPRDVTLIQPACGNGADCDDTLFCNGEEICEEGTCVSGTIACEIDQYCDDTSDRCTECLIDEHCPIGYNCISAECAPNGTMQVDKCKVKAGKNGKGDSIKFSGFLDAISNDLIEADNVIVTIDADDIPDLNVTTYMFPITYLKKGKYKSPKVKPVYKSDPKTSVKIDTVKGKFKFSAKNVDLTGLSCPITVQVQIGDYLAEAQLDENIVNGTKKTCPLELMMGIQDSLSVIEINAEKGPYYKTDAFTIMGTFTIDGPFDSARPVVIMLGSSKFTISDDEFSLIEGIYSCNNVVTNNGVVTAKFDTVAGNYTITITNTSLPNNGDVDFGIDIFGKDLVVFDQVTLRPEF